MEVQQKNGTEDFQGKIHNLTIDNGVLTIDDNVIASSTSTAFDSTAVSIILFACKSGSDDSITRLANKVKIYFCKIYDEGTLIRDFVPCISPENEVGLYDLVEDKFYKSNGTGEFSAQINKKQISVTKKGIVNCDYLSEGYNITKIYNKGSILETNQVQEF